MVDITDIKRLAKKIENKYDYAKDIDFEDILTCLEEIISVVSIETV